jgi:hypothetical protein
MLCACLFLAIETAAAQPANMGCSPQVSANGSQILRCEGGVTIVAENGARFTLGDRDGNGRSGAMWVLPTSTLRTPIFLK